ncbi:MAG TPA: GNAT family N-acetyltransferase [Flavisolibacter sp.]|nr:GNAT family N-acetyltransferase [Flavisolibacter sp.]
MDIQHKADRSSGMFFIEEKGETIAEIVYSQTDGQMIIEHTEVDPVLRGKNVGYYLVSRTVEYARENKYTIKPVCVYAKAVIEKHRDMHDVLA